MTGQMSVCLRQLSQKTYVSLEFRDRLKYFEVFLKTKMDCKCPTCQKSFPTKYGLARHLRVHQSKVENVVCEVCSKPFANKANLKTHLNDIHGLKEITHAAKIWISNKGVPVKMKDASTQTEWDDSHLPPKKRKVNKADFSS